MESYTHQAERLFNVVLSSEQIEQFSIFEKLLLEWNQKINLTAIRDVQGIHTKHFLDSLSAVKGFNGGIPISLIDIGTGAGFPGIPLKIAYPQIRLVLVESVGKKAKFCQLVVDSLALTGVEVLANGEKNWLANPGTGKILILQ